MSNWGSDPGPRRGRGIAFTLSFGVPVAQVVDDDFGLRADSRGRAYLACVVFALVRERKFARGGPRDEDLATRLKLASDRLARL